MASKYGKKSQDKVHKAMKERKQGKLKSGSSGKKVTSRKQAIAIGLSEARREGGKVPSKKKSSKKSSSKKSSSTQKRISVARAGWSANQLTSCSVCYRVAESIGMSFTMNKSQRANPNDAKSMR